MYFVIKPPRVALLTCLRRERHDREEGEGLNIVGALNPLLAVNIFGSCTAPLKKCSVPWNVGFYGGTICPPAIGLNVLAMISAGRKSDGFPATHKAKVYGFVFFFFCLKCKTHKI